MYIISLISQFVYWLFFLLIVIICHPKKEKTNKQKNENKQTKNNRTKMNTIIKK